MGRAPAGLDGRAEITLSPCWRKCRTRGRHGRHAAIRGLPERAKRARDASGSARPPDAGLTLIEVLVATLIVAIAGAAVVGGLGTVARSSAQHRTLANEETTIRDVAELLVKPPNTSTDPYTNCTSTTTPSYTDPVSTPPTNLTVAIAVTGYWNGMSGTTPTFSGSCPSGGDEGMQQVKVTISAPAQQGGLKESLTVIKARL